MKEKIIEYESLITVLRNMTEKERIFDFFLYACKNESLDLCQACLDAGANINIVDYDDKMNLLMNLLFKSENVTIKVVDWLINNGLDINYKKYYGSVGITALTIACKNGNYEIAKRLIDKGAKIRKIKENQSENDLKEAVNGKNCKIVDLLLKSGETLEGDIIENDSNPFMMAVEYGTYEMVEVFLKNGLSPNFQTYSGMTPLGLAISSRRKKIAQLLLNYTF